MDTAYEDEIVLDPGPGLIAHIAITVARAGDRRVRDRMDDRQTTIEITAQNSDDLAVRVARYASNAVRSIGDPGYGNVAVALHAAMRTGIEYEYAARGAFFDRDALPGIPNR